LTSFRLLAPTIMLDRPIFDHRRTSSRGCLEHGGTKAREDMTENCPGKNTACEREEREEGPLRPPWEI
jgi:hypothetical protein